MIRRNTTFINPRPSQIRLTNPVNMINQQRVFARVGGRRPIDKKIIVVNKDGVDATQVSTVLVTATFPCTIVGLRWTFTFIQGAGTGNCSWRWAIVLLKDGETIGTTSITDGADLYTPEQNVMTFGLGLIDNNVVNQVSVGDTKSMRKLMGGDRLVFVLTGVATNTVSCRGAVQFFCKT